MKNKRWNKALALVLSLVLLASTVSASGYTLDLSGDGKVNVWDVQLAVNDGKGAAHEEAILDNILGGGDELHPNTEGVYEIYSIIGINNMAKLANKGYSFKLMKDIDLGGADWAPIANFRGNFDGNLKTISNFKITKSAAVSDGANMGFFGTVDHNGKDADGNTVQSVVKDLNLKDVEITATEDATYIGLIAGSNRGKIQNCTTEGLVIDNRTTLAAPAYVGTIVGRNNNSTPAGNVASGTNTLTATAGSSNSEDKVEGVTSKLAMDFADLTYPEGTESSKQYKRNIGIAGNSKDANIDTAMIWQDVSNSFSLKPEAEQERRQGVVDEMYRQGTVQWTTSELLTYTVNGSKTSIHSNIYIPGTTYYGLPYNSVGGGYDRAMAIMQEEKDSEGRYVTVTGLENGVKDAEGSSGFIEMMGNDCSSAIGWAWAAVAPARLANAGVRVNTTPYMIPNDYNTKNYGVLASGGYQTLTTTFPENKHPVDACDTQSIIALNGGAQGMAEYYAKAGRGDALLCVEYDYDATADKWTKGTGHARMLAYEPVIIRNYKGEIDLNVSYAITHEQGDGLFDNRNASGKYDTMNGYQIKQTSWRIDYKYPLNVLLTQEGYNAATNPGCGWGYVPVTIPAFTYEGELRDPYCNDGYTSETNYHPVILPNSGWNYTNWMIASATMTITDAEGKVVYNKTGYPAGRTYATENVKLDVLFPDAADNLTAGQTYYITLEVLAANGQIIYGDYKNITGDGTTSGRLNNFQFVYNPAE